VSEDVVEAAEVRGAAIVGERPQVGAVQLDVLETRLPRQLAPALDGGGCKIDADEASPRQRLGQ
jgi:hypothetical protein